MIEVLFSVLFYLFMLGIGFLGLDKHFSFAPASLTESVQNYVNFYEYVSWTFLSLAWILLLGGATEYKERITVKAAERHQIFFYVRNLVYFVLTLISVALLKDYSLGALFIVTMLFYAHVHSMKK